MGCLRQFRMLAFIQFLVVLGCSNGFVIPSSPSIKASSSASSLTSTSLYGVRSGIRRARDSLLNKERSREDLKLGIAGFYDRSSKLWEDVWGEVRRLMNTYL